MRFIDSLVIILFLAVSAAVEQYCEFPPSKDKFGFKKIDIHSDKFLFDLVCDNYKNKDFYFTLKASHLFWDKIHFKKTMYDLFLINQISAPYFFNQKEYKVFT